MGKLNSAIYRAVFIEKWHADPNCDVPTRATEAKAFAQTAKNVLVEAVNALSPAQPAQDRRILAPWNPCLEKLRDGEPFFVLLGRDMHAAAAVRCWADQREAERGVSGKTTEARRLADQMDAYRGVGVTVQPAQGADIARELAELIAIPHTEPGWMTKRNALLAKARSAGLLTTET